MDFDLNDDQLDDEGDDVTKHILEACGQMHHFYVVRVLPVMDRLDKNEGTKCQKANDAGTIN